VVQWYSGTVVQWYSGTVVQWYRIDVGAEHSAFNCGGKTDCKTLVILRIYFGEAQTN